MSFFGFYKLSIPVTIEFNLTFVKSNVEKLVRYYKGKLFSILFRIRRTERKKTLN